MTAFYIDKIPVAVTIFNFCLIFSIFLLSLFILSRVITLETTKKSLQSAEEYNKSLTILYDEVKGFNHDFKNIVSAIDGYICTNNIDGLKKYIDEVYLHNIFYKGTADYGRGGLFKGKKYMYSITCNPSEDVFDNPNLFFGTQSPEDLIVALHKIQQFCGMEPVKSYFCFDVVHNPDIEKYLKGLDNHLHTYVLNDRLA